MLPVLNTAGLEVPAVCSDDRLKPAGACRAMPTCGRRDRCGISHRMDIVLNISDSAAKHFGDTPDAIGRNLLHKAALEDYREGRISEGRFAEILGISRWEAQDILDQHHARQPYTLEMLEEDRRNFASIFGAQ